MEYGPNRTEKTHLWYIYGPTRAGKTTSVNRILSYVRQHYGIDYYLKMSGLRKFWDGYDYQPIVWIDDPGLFVTNTGGIDYEAADMFKALISHQPMLVEVKGASLQFRSKLVIITSNYSPIDLTGSVSVKDQPPIRERLEDIPPLYFKDVPSRVKHTKTLCKRIVHMFELDVPYMRIHANLPAIPGRHVCSDTSQ